MAGYADFPLPGLLRQVAESHLTAAEEWLEVAERDVRLLLDGEPRTTTFKESVDPVDNLKAAATQLELCRVVLKMDDEARKEQS